MWKKVFWFFFFTTSEDIFQNACFTLLVLSNLILCNFKLSIKGIKTLFLNYYLIEIIIFLGLKHFVVN